MLRVTLKEEEWTEFVWQASIFRLPEVPTIMMLCPPAAATLMPFLQILVLLRQLSKIGFQFILPC